MSKAVLKLAEGRKQAQEGGIVKKAQPSRKRSAEETITEEAPIVVNSNKKVKLSVNLRPVESNVKSSRVAAKKSSEANEAAGKVIYLGHIPEGFNEKLMRKFFNQYGEVSKIKLFKSLKTNRSMGYAFVEFESAEVAAIAAESMNGYFLMERKLVSHVVSADKIHKGMFAKPKVDPSLRRKSSASSDDEDAEASVDENNFARVAALHAKSMEKKQAKLAELGIEFEIPFAKPVDARLQAAEAPAEKKPAAKKTPKKTKSS